MMFTFRDKHDFTCNATPDGTIRVLETPRTLAVPLDGTRSVVAQGQAVAKGELLSLGRVPGGPAAPVHAPAAGTVERVDRLSAHIATGPGETVDSRPLPGDRGELAKALFDMGLLPVVAGKVDTLVINGLNREPGLATAEALLGQRAEVLRRGVEVLKRAATPRRTVLTVRTGSGHSLSGCGTFEMPAVYPWTLNPLVAAAATGDETPDALVVDALDLWAIGRAADVGLPRKRTVLTLGSQVYEVAVGTPLRDLFALLGVTVADGDRVALGGPFTGAAARSLDQGVAAGTDGLTLVRAGTHAAVTDAPCMECGSCVRICPSRIDPCLLAGLAEFKLWSRAEDSHVLACVECGLCGYVCPSRRPMLQYLRWAKAEVLAQAAAEAAKAAESAENEGSQA